jgi:hypothetical protein
MIVNSNSDCCHVQHERVDLSNVNTLFSVNTKEVSETSIRTMSINFIGSFGSYITGSIPVNSM